ncbi:hypothetical protein CSKR_109312 [Clonorchis sinensis]|uniref:Uncharacterized protein n=1 Tax=Clonorchis sinensis TaxID=79923 RepID=A0A419Q1L6_CLOSI|nr:hypothetical protein CSKR_109312 [Clonorchis sinensis]
MSNATPWLEHEFTDQKFRGSNPTSASQLLLSRPEQPGSSSALMFPSDGMAVGYWKYAAAKRYTPGKTFFLILIRQQPRIVSKHKSLSELRKSQFDSNLGGLRKADPSI